MQDVAVEEDRFPAVAEPFDDLADVVSPHGVETVGRLVEDQQVGVVHQGLGEPQALAHSLAEPTYRFSVAVAEPDQFEEFVDAGTDLRFAHPAESAVEPKRRAGGMVRIDAERFGEVADPLPCGGRSGGATEQRRVPGGGPDHAEQRLDERRFAGAVGAEQPEHLAGVGTQRNPGERLDPTAAGDGPTSIDLREVFDFDDRGGNAHTDNVRINWITSVASASTIAENNSNRWAGWDHDGERNSCSYNSRNRSRWWVESNTPSSTNS